MSQATIQTPHSDPAQLPSTAPPPQAQASPTQAAGNAGASGAAAQGRAASSAQAAPGEGAARGLPAFELLRRQMAHCGEYSYQALNKLGRLSPEDTSRVTQRYLKELNTCERGRPFPDALHYLVVSGWKIPELEVRDTLLELTRALIRYSKTKVSHLTFAHQTETPIDFYNSFPGIAEISRLLSCPVTQTSEKDFLTVTSINPFTASAAARLISNELEAEVGRKPFTFVTTTDLNAWKYACERHFGT